MQDVIPYIKDSFNFLKNNLIGIALVLLPFIVLFQGISLVLAQVSDDEKNNYILNILAIGLLVSPFYQASLVLYMKSIVNGEYWSPMQCYIGALKYWLPLISLYILMGLAVFAGLMLLIVPGLVLIVRLTFAEFICVLDGKRSQEAFVSSIKETEPYQWLLFKGLLLLFVLVRLPAMVVVELFDKWQISNIVLSTLGGAVYTIISTVFTIFLFRVYTLHKSQGKKTEPATEVEQIDDDREDM